MFTGSGQSRGDNPEMTHEGEIYAWPLMTSCDTDEESVGPRH